jgi:hypothetical protein
MREWIMGVFASPSGRASSRRHTWVWSVIGALIVAVWQGLTGGDVASGTLALFTAILTATGAAVTAGRFAERGSETPTEPKQ